MKPKVNLIPTERIERLILLIRGQKVILDRELAALYGVETRALNQAVRRNKKRFPADFMFELNREEIRNISQIVTCSGIKHSRSVLAFTEQGVAMLSGILNSARAIDVNIEIMRAFVRLCGLLASQEQLTRKLLDIEEHLDDHDQKIHAIFEALRQMMNPPEKTARQIGYRAKEQRIRYHIAGD